MFKRLWLTVPGLALLLLAVGLCLFYFYFRLPAVSPDPIAKPLTLQANEAVFPPRTWQSAVPTDTFSIVWGDLLHDEVYSATQVAWNYEPAASGYIAFASRCETAIRTPAEQAYSMMVAIKTGLFDSEPSLKADVRAKSLLLIRSLAYHHIANDADKSDPGRWGYDASADDSRCLNSVDAPQGGKANMQSAWWAEMAGFAAWLSWDDLAVADREQVRRMVEYEANRYTRSQMYVGSYDSLTARWSNVWSPNILYLRDKEGKLPAYDSTFAEEDAWNVRILDLALAMMPDHNNWNIWNAKALELSLAALSRPSDTNDSTDYIAGRPLSAWLNGSNIEDDGTLYDHNIIYPNYMGAIIHSMHSSIIAALAGKPDALARLHNVSLVYDALVNWQFAAPLYNAPGGSIYRPAQTPQPGYDVYYPQNLPGTPSQAPPRKHDLFAQIDAEVGALGLDIFEGRNNSAAYWQALHMQGVYQVQAPAGTISQQNAHFKGLVLGDYDWPKAADAYLTLWLQYQAGSTTPPPVSDLPPPWRDSDIGPTAQVGRSTYENEQFTLTKAAEPPSAPAQEPTHMVYQTWEGDGELVAHINISGLHAGSGSGLFMREDLSPSSPFLQLRVDGVGGGASLVYSAEPGASIVTTRSANSGSWLKLAREGSRFYAYVGSGGGDAVIWTSVGSIDIAISGQLFLGMFIAGGGGQSIFDSVKISRSNQELPVTGVSASPGSSLGADCEAQLADCSGSPNTLWSARGDGGEHQAPWVEYDLGENREVGAVGIVWGDGGTRNYSFEVLASNSDPVVAPDDRRWDRVYADTGTGTQEEKYYFMPVVARYIRIIGRGNSLDDWNSISNLTVYGSDLAEAPVKAVASGKDTGKDKPENVLDNLLDTKWSVDTHEENQAWLEADLGNSTMIDGLAVAWTNGNHSKYAFRIDVSSDQQRWSTVFDGASSGTTQLKELYNFPKIASRWIKVTCLGSFDGNSCSISEIAAYLHQ